MELFEYYNNRIEKITKLLNEYGVKDLDEAKDICKSYNIFPEVSVKEVQNIAFDDVFAVCMHADSVYRETSSTA